MKSTNYFFYLEENECVIVSYYNFQTDRAYQGDNVSHISNHRESFSVEKESCVEIVYMMVSWGVARGKT